MKLWARGCSALGASSWALPNRKIYLHQTYKRYTSPERSSLGGQLVNLGGDSPVGKRDAGLSSTSNGGVRRFGSCGRFGSGRLSASSRSGCCG